MSQKNICKYRSSLRARSPAQEYMEKRHNPVIGALYEVEVDASSQPRPPPIHSKTIQHGNGYSG